MPVNLPPLADHVAIASKTLLPIRIAEHQDWIRPGSLPLGGRDQASQLRLHTQSREIVARHAAQHAVVAFFIRGYSHKRRALRKDVAEDVRLLPNIEVIRVRKTLETLRAFLLHGQHGDLLAMRTRHGPPKNSFIQ